MIIFVDCSKLRETLEDCDAETWLFNPPSTGFKRLKAANCQTQCRGACAHAPAEKEALKPSEEEATMPASSSPEAAEENLPPLPPKVKGAPWPPEVCGKVFLNKKGKKVRISGSGVKCEKACEASGCGRQAQGKTNFCSYHGDGSYRRYCQQPGGCNRGAEGKTNFCADNGGGAARQEPGRLQGDLVERATLDGIIL